MGTAKIFPAFLLLLLLPLACPQLVEVPQLAVSSSVVLYENGTVSVTSGELRSLEISLSVPRQAPYQQVSIDGDVFSDSDGNSYVKISSASPQTPFRYSKRLEVKNTHRITPSLPETYVVPAEYAPFLAPSARTQSDDPGIRAFAMELTKDSADPFEKVARLAVFTNKWLEYDVSLTGEEKDAVWTLENKRGVCVEYATLFSALARSVGIPVRYVTGYAYNDQLGGWLGHTWNEAYVGEWIPIDATWFEVGTLDALHIEAGKYAEISRGTSLSAKVSDQSAQLVWKTEGQEGAAAKNIVSVDARASNPSSQYSFGVAESRLTPGGSTIAYVSMAGSDYRVVPLTLVGCKGEIELSLAGRDGGGMQYLLLRPGRNSTAAWEINAPSELDTRFVYTCPLTLNSPYLSRNTVEITIDPRIGELPHYIAATEKSAIAPGEGNSAILTLPFQRQAKNYLVVSDSGVFGKRAAASTEQIAFSSGGIGELEAYVAGEGGGFQKLQYTSGANSSVAIGDFGFRSAPVEGKTAIAHATVSASSYPADIYVKFTFDGAEQAMRARIGSPEEMEFRFVPASAGSKQAGLSAKIESSAGGQYALNIGVDVAMQPTLAIEGARTTKGAGGLSTEVTISKSGNPVSPLLRINGGAYPAAGKVQLSLPAGDYFASLSWADAAGNAYSSEKKISVREPGILEDIAAKVQPGQEGASAEPPPAPCPLASAILLAALGAAFASCRGGGCHD